jgi:putative metallohydrolase (TIGR04338 family)
VSAHGNPIDHDDPDRLAVYAAEQEALPDGGRRFHRFADVEAFVRFAMAEAWWEEQFPEAPVYAELHRRSRSATYSAAHVTDDGWDAVIWIRDGSWDAVTVVHELAHVAAGRWSIEPGHGRRFVDALCRLWRRHLGVQAYGALRLALAERGVILDHHGAGSGVRE